MLNRNKIPDCFILNFSPFSLEGLLFQKNTLFFFLNFLGLFKFSALNVIAKSFGYAADRRNVQHLSIDKHTCVCYIEHKTLCCAAIKAKQSWDVAALIFPLSYFTLAKRGLGLLAESCFIDSLWDIFRKVSRKFSATFIIWISLSSPHGIWTLLLCP